MSANLGDAAYQKWFDAWALELIAAYGARNPAVVPYDYKTFDGCTSAPDICRHCCLVHDLDYHYGENTREAADARLAECIKLFGEHEGRDWRWLWSLNAWVYFVAVRIFGGTFYHAKVPQLDPDQSSRALVKGDVLIPMPPRPEPMKDVKP